MAIKTYRPTTQTLRYQTTLVNDDITTNKPHKPLVEPKQKTGGRRNSGQITSRFRGGGNKRKLRLIDFKRDKTGIPATVISIEYDPNRSARIALLSYADGEKRYIVQPDGLKMGKRSSAARMPTSWSATRYRCATFPRARPCTTLSCGRARARRWCVRRVVRRSWSPRKATMRSSSCLRARPARCCRIAWRQSGRSATPITRTSPSARQDGFAGRDGVRTIAASP